MRDKRTRQTIHKLKVRNIGAEIRRPGRGKQQTTVMVKLGSQNKA